MSAYADIMREHDEAVRQAGRVCAERVRRLRESCPHAERSNWLQGYDTDQRICRQCHKTLETRPGGVVGLYHR